MISQPSSIIEAFPVDINATTLIHDSIGENASLHLVNAEDTRLLSGVTGENYILDSLAGGEIACYPYLVGEELKKRCLKAAYAFRNALQVLDLYNGLSILHILRGAIGYMVPEVFPADTPLLSIRTEYREDGYRSHSDDSRRLEVTYRDYPTDRVSSLIIPDTYATGRSAETGIMDLINHGLHPENVILYGFIAASSLNHLGQLCKEQGITLYSFAICNITPLAYNNYDMPIYGLDESFYTETGEIRHLGGVIPPETFERLIPEYVAGADQPGDWSERHRVLYNGAGEEHGDIVGHLEKSSHMINTLNSLNSRQDWYTELHREIAEKTQRKIGEQLRNYKTTTL